MKLRPLVESDAAMLFAWRCDSDVVHSSIKRERPSEDGHRAWMIERMLAARYKALIAEADDGASVGTCTFLVTEDGMVWLSYMVAPELRGRGVGAALVNEALRNSGAREVLLEIREDNGRSLAVAIKCGFEEVLRRKDGFVQFRKVIA